MSSSLSSPSHTGQLIGRQRPAKKSSNAENLEYFRPELVSNIPSIYTSTNCKMSERVEKDKKRKRLQDGFSKPSKRVAIESDKQVEFLLQEADNWAPVIGRSTFQPLFIDVLLTYKSINTWCSSSLIDCPHAILQSTTKCASQKGNQRHRD